MVISAPWLSRMGNGTINVRGVSLVLALAKTLKSEFCLISYGVTEANEREENAVWAKDLIFLISDGEMEGAHAFLSAYHGEEQKGIVP
jgi:glycosylphosphatidylinositol transamidase